MTQLFYLGPSSQISQYQMPVKHLKFISEYHSSSWRRGTVVERRSLAGELPRPAIDLQLMGDH